MGVCIQETKMTEVEPYRHTMTFFLPFDVTTLVNAFSRIVKGTSDNDNLSEKSEAKVPFYGGIGNFFILFMYLCQCKRQIYYYGKETEQNKDRSGR